MYVALIVEDDADLAEITAAHLIHSGYQVDMAYTCAQAEEMLSKREYDLILLDEVLPDRSGDELCRTIRTKCACPIIFMSCLDDSDTIISALRSGGDDYMVKPVDEEEMLLRIAALLRRSRIVADRRLNIGGTELNFNSMSVTVAGKTESLPKKEFLLLFKLLSYPGRIFTRRQLMDEIWDLDSESDERTVDVHINRLRDRFRGNADFEIQTVRGLGYKAVLRA